MKRRTFLRRLSNAALLGAPALLPACPVRGSRVHILGSGITGLCVGALLAKEGFHVHVLESHPELLGGHAASFERRGLRFCVGPQYVWGFRGDGIGARVLQHLGLADDVPFDSMDPDGFEVYRIGEKAGITIPMGLEPFRQTAMDTYPDDHAGLDRFFSYVQDLHQGATVVDRLALYTRGEPAMVVALLLDEALPARVKIRFHQCRRWSLARLFDHCELSSAARRFLYATSGLFVENESDVSCIAYAAATGFLHAGADYPRYGFQSLVRGLSDSITRAGGIVQTGKRISSLRRSGNRVSRVDCLDGDSFATDLVISTLSPRITFGLIAPRVPWKAFYDPSNSAVSAFIGVRDYPTLPHQLARRGTWWQDGTGPVDFQTPDMTRPPRLLALASPSSNGNYNMNAYPGDQSLIVFAPGSFAQAAEAYSEGSAAHDDLRAQLTAQLLDTLETQLLPDLRQYIRFLEVQTPYDLYLRTDGEAANVYGRRLTAESLLTRPYAQLGVGNLHVACATAGMPGIATAFQTAALLAEQLTNRALPGNC